MKKGPAITDEVFFNSLKENLISSGSLAESGNYTDARREFAFYIRNNLDRDRFFSIPYETPENIFKLEGETDEEACRRIEEYKVVSVGVLGDFSKTKRIDWFSNPTYNDYKEWPWQLSRHNEIKMMAHEYNRTKDEKIARTALDIMHSWIESAPAPKTGTIGYETICWRTIECGIRMGANWPYILFSFINSPYFTDDLIVDWFKSVYEHAIRLSNDYTRANWLIMEMNGLAHIGILFPFFKEAEKWKEFAIQSLSEELEKQFYSDGFQYELTTNYHDVVINNYQRLFETAKAFGYELPNRMKETLTKGCNVMVKLQMSDGTLPDINDGRRIKTKALIEPKARFFSSAEISFALKEGPEPGYTSLVLPYSGFAVFRTGWKIDDVWALLDAAPFGRAHQHEDKLNFLIYAAGKYLLTEGGIYAYDESEMRKYILSTRSHNTIRVDGCDQDRRSKYEWQDKDISKPAGIITNIPNDNLEYAEGSYDEGYKGIKDKITHTRRVFFLKKERVFVVIDHLNSEVTHEYELIYHVDDKRLSGTDFENIRFSILTPGTVTEVVRAIKEPELQGFIAYGQAQGSYKAVDTIISRAKGKDLFLVTVVEIKDGKGKPLISAQQTADSVVLRFDDRTENIIF